MINAVIIDKNQTSKEIIIQYLQEFENIFVLSSLDNISDIENLENIDLIILDITSSEADDILDKVKEFKNKNKSLNFIATSYEINSQLVSKILSEGIDEFILKPAIKPIFKSAIEKIINIKNNNHFKKAKTISIFSNKAGVGKTSLAVNFAYDLASKTKENVCLLDLSFNSEDISTYLDINNKFNTDYIISNLENSNKELLLSLIPKYNDNLYVLAIQDEINLNEKFNPKSITKIINSLKNIFDWIVIDTLSLINENNVAILNNCDLIFLICLLNMVNIRNCQKCLELFDNIGYNNDKIKLIVNRYIQNSQITIKDIESTLKEVFYKIPNNYLTLIDAINLGKTVIETNPNSNIARAYQNITNEIINTDFSNLNSITTFNHGVFNLLRRMGE